MQYIIFRLLKEWVFVLFLLMAVSYDADAGLITDGYQYRVWDTSNEAEAGANAYCAAFIAYLNNHPQAICRVIHIDLTPPAHDGEYRSECGAFGSSYGVCGTQLGGVDPSNFYLTESPQCEAEVGTQLTHWASATLPNYMQHTSACKDQCQYDVVVGTASDQCVYDDTNSSGAADDGDTYSCPATYQYNGTECDSGNTVNESSNPQYFDCTNVDCSSDSDPGGGTGTNDGGGTTPGQDTGSNTNPSPGTGDGDPDTPTTGTGSGDVDGDGDRDIDCDPSSNPDCGYTGSGTGSGNCDVQPSCSGDPVQCAILYQEWASMCYDGATLNNPENCNAQLVCEGDKLKCEIIRQQRDQYCDLYYGDGSLDLDVFNDTDFTDDPIGDLRAETTPSSIMDLVDITPASGTCPAGIDTSVYGVAIQFSLQPFCDLAPFIRALVLISAWLSAVMMVIGVERK